MIYLICIARDQEQHSSNMLFNTPNHYKKIRVVDRSENDHGIGWDIVIRNDTGSGFLAGRMRELGIAYAIKQPDCEGILFLDGDRIPIINNLSNAIDPNRQNVILFQCENDNREPIDNFHDCSNACYQLENSPFYTCGSYVPIKFITACIDTYGSCFDPDFDGNWGEEDRHFGDRLVSLGAHILCAPRKFLLKGSVMDRYQQGVPKTNFYIRKKKCTELSNLLKLRQKYVKTTQVI